MAIEASKRATLIPRAVDVFNFLRLAIVVTVKNRGLPQP
jgi:hypothetical protein